MNYNGTNDDSAPATDRMVQLLDQDGIEIDSVQTDSNGDYTFVEVDPRQTYQIQMSSTNSDDMFIDHSLTTDTIITEDGLYDNEGTSLFNIVANEQLLDIDGSLYRYADADGLAFIDMDGNGQQNFADLDEYKSGTLITLTGTDGMGNTVEQTDLTIDGDRIYFNDLNPGNYTITYTIPGSYKVTWKDKGDDATDSDVNRTDANKTFDLLSDDYEHVDVGMYEPVTIGGYVFTDTDRDGYLTAGEDVPAENYSVEIYYDGELSTTVTTDSDGYFELSGVEPGNYSTKVTALDSSYEFTIKGTNGDGLIASDVDSDGRTPSVLILSGTDDYIDYDTGYNQRTSISGKIYLDTNADLSWQDTELLIDGISVDLLDEDGNIAETTTTDSEGYYEFTNIVAGDYTVEASTVNYAHYQNEDEDPSIQSDAKTPLFTAYSNTPVENVDGSLTINNDTTHYLISDYVWEDLNYDGVQGSDEPALSGVEVTLLDSSGSEVIYNDSYPDLGISSGDVATTTTDSNGNYLLIVEGAGDYQVKVEASDQYYLTGLDAGSDDTLDNDFAPVDENTHIGYLDYTVDRDTRDVDSGLSDKGTISGYIYNDQNKNNMYDMGFLDYPVEYTEVGLFTADGETLLETTESDAEGYYEFTDLEANNYIVRYEDLAPHNAYWLQEADGTLYLDNGGYEAYREIDLGYGQDLTLQNAGQNNQSLVAGIAFEDIIADGVYDADEDILLEGVEAHLLTLDGEPVLNDLGEEEVVTTDSDGLYYFINMDPGIYYVEFIIPDGYAATNVVPSGAEDTSDNDASVEDATLRTGNIIVQENNGYITQSDVALYQPINISGYYYDDYDINGQYSDGLDQPIENGVVNLYNLDDEVVLSTTTDSSGYYQFTDVVPNDYYIGFDTSGYDVISILGTDDTAYDNDLKQDSTTDSIRYESGSNHATENDAAVYNLADISGYIFEDKNNNGYYETDTEDGIETTVTLYDGDDTLIDSTVTNSDGSYLFVDLTPNDYYVTVENPGSEYYNAKLGTNSEGVIATELTDSLQFDTQTIYSGQDDSINFDGGFYQLTDIEGQVFFDSDTNFELNDSEFGIANLDITLYSEDDMSVPVATTVTDSDGNYAFNDIIPGNYVVTSSSTVFGDYEDMPEAYQIKSDMSTPVFTAYSNTLRDNVDGAVTKGTDVYLIGDYVWEDINNDGLQSVDEPAFSGMQIDLIDSSDATVDTYTTDTDGLYYFFAPKGDYTLSFTADEDYHFTTNVTSDNSLNSDPTQTVENISTAAITVDRNDLTYDAGVRRDANINGRVYYDTDASGTWDESIDESTEERTVTLYSGSTIIDTQTINLTADGTEGTYNFTNLEPGDYTIEFSDSTNKFWVQNSDGLLIFDNSTEGPATREVTLDYGQTLNDQDAGYSTGASIAGFIYEDNDYDGTFSKYLAVPTNDDIAIESAVVNLVDNSGNVLDTTTTDSNGFYSFGNLEPYQSYATEVENKDDDSDGINDYTVTTLGIEATKYDNDMVDSGVIETETHTLGDNQYDDYNYDGGLLEYTNLSGYVYEDLEVNSTMDATDLGLENITANLYDSDDNLVESTTTDSSGYYQFSNIYPGYYYVQFDLAGYEVSPKGSVATALDSDIDSSYQTSLIDVQSRNNDDVNFDAGVYTLVSVGGTVFTDGNADGLYTESNEDGLTNIIVSLYNDQDQLIDTAPTDSNGQFEFTDLMPDQYYTKVATLDYLISPIVTDSGVTNDLKQDKSTAIQYVPSSTTNYNDYDAGLYELTAISGKIYLDTNADLTRQDSEWLIPNLAVTLYDGSKTVVAETVTDENGYYEFTDLTPGDYEVVAATTDYATYENEDEVPSIQSDASTGVFTAISGTPSENVDGALTIGGDDHHFIISDYVWEDTNYNGIQDDTEPVMAGVTVRLLDSSGNQLSYTQDYPGLGISSGDKIETETDSEGNYMLIAESEGDFIVETEASSDYYITATDTVSDNLDNDFTAVTASTNIGRYEYYADRDTIDVDSGYSEVGTIAGNVYDDENDNFTYNSSIDIDVANSPVELYEASNLTTPMMTTTTDSSGYYEFKDLQAGDYVVRFENLYGLDGFWVPEADDSLILENNGYESYRNVSISYGEDKLHENAGKSETIVFSGIAFEDMIADGIYDPAEDKLIEDVDVVMLDDTGAIATTVPGENLERSTNTFGQYIMSHFLPGDYQVRFTTPDGYIETNVLPDDAKTTKNNDAILNGAEYITNLFNLDEEIRYYSTYADASFYQPVTIEGDYYEDKNIDGKYDSDLDVLLEGYTVNLVDADDNIIATTTTDDNGHYIFEDVVPGNYKIQFDISSFDQVSMLGDEARSYDNDLNSDGYTSIGRYTSGNTYNVENDGAVYNYAMINGYVYEDGNNDGYMADTENGLRAEVTLYDGLGNTQSVYSNHNGYYEFTNLLPGKYYVVITPPSEAYYVASQGDNELGLASDINNSYTTTSHRLYSSDINDTDYDGGMYRLSTISGELFWDANEDLTDDGSDFGIWDVKVSLYNADEVATKAAKPVATTLTDSEGNYRFDNVIPGDYVVQMDNTYFGYYENMPSNFQVKDDGYTEIFTVISGDERTAVDGAVTRGIGINYIGDYVWEDTNFNGQQDEDEVGYQNATVNLIDEAGNVVDTIATDSDGYYDFFAPSGNYQIEVVVDEDYHFTVNNTDDTDINSDTLESTDNSSMTDLFDASYNRRDIDSGVRLDGNISGRVYYDKDASGTYNNGDQSTEPRTVSLYKTNGILRSDQLIETVDIDLETGGLFNFSNLTEGNYRLEFSDDENRFWIENADGQLQFDNSQEGIATRNVTVDYGQTVTDQDAGYAYGAAISGYIFNDDNYNGMYDLDEETPEAGVNVHLMNDDGQEIGITKTDSDGHYGFTNLEPGHSYSTVIDVNDSDGDGNPDYSVTDQVVTNTKLGNDMTDEPGWIETSQVMLNDNELNDIDFDGGIVYHTDLSGYAYQDLDLNSTYNDQDVMLDQITVTLYDNNDSQVAKTVTDDGYYQFTNIEAGYYYVGFELDGYNVSAKGNKDTMYDNDIDSNYITSTIDVKPVVGNDVSFDAAVYTDEDEQNYIESQKDDSYNDMTIANTGQKIFMAIIATIVLLCTLIFIKRKINQ